jgi:hypothetical protein
MDMIAKLLVSSGMCSFDVTRCTHGNLNASIVIELILDHVIVVTQSGDGSDNENVVLNNSDIAASSMPGNGKTGVSLEDTDTPLPKRCIQVAGSLWAIETRNKSVHLSAKASNCRVHIVRLRSKRVIGSIERKGFLHLCTLLTACKSGSPEVLTKLVDDALFLVIDVVQTKSK